MPSADIDRRQALLDLLLLPDSPDLPRRSNRITVQGRSDRFKQLPFLASSFVQTKLMELAERETWRTEHFLGLEPHCEVVSQHAGFTASQMLERCGNAAEAARQMSQRVSLRALSYLGFPSPKAIGVRRGTGMPRLTR